MFLLELDDRSYSLELGVDIEGRSASWTGLSGCRGGRGSFS